MIIDFPAENQAVRNSGKQLKPGPDGKAIKKLNPAWFRVMIIKPGSSIINTQNSPPWEGGVAEGRGGSLRCCSPPLDPEEIKRRMPGKVVMKIKNKILMIVFVFQTLLLAGCVVVRTQEEIEQIISKSETLQRLDRLCAQIPVGRDARFDGKGLGGNTNLAVVTYFYDYGKNKEDELIPHKWLLENGWEQTKPPKFESFKYEAEYAKGRQMIMIIKGGYGSADHKFSCKESR